MPRYLFDANQDPFRPNNGDREFIRTRDGEARVVRIYMPGDRAWRYTQLGRRFYSAAQTQYIVEVPVIISGRTRNGSDYYAKRTWLSVEVMGMGRVSMPMIMGDAVKQQVIEHMEAFRDGDRFLIYEFSGRPTSTIPWVCGRFQLSRQGRGTTGRLP